MAAQIRPSQYKYMKKYKHICFDYYGTLVDMGSPFKMIQKWMEDEVASSGQAVKSALLFMYFKRYYAYNLSKNFLPGEEIIKNSFIRSCERIKIFLPVEKFMLFIFRLFSEPIKYPDVDYTLSILREKYKVSILSNADNNIILRSIYRQNIKYDYLVTSEDAKANKPDRAFFLYAASALNVAYEDILLIGDSLTDDIGAKIFGIDTIWINRSEKEVLGTNKPEAIIHTLSELVVML